ncbi:reactive mitochondrial oxygen species modulator 1-domain-containing protein [Hysterangium stoloniferum]|nr:reactive mitochondrial oxygen species modulator 1-domain-containing protein [Hysterangium stoloniferum]
MQRVPQSHHEPTIWQKCKMGALMGGGVGLTIGFIFGSYSIIRGGAGPRGALATLSQYMLSSAATFSFFLAIGSVIRTDAQFNSQLYASQRRLLPPHIASRVQSAELIRARWQNEKIKRN